MRGEKFIPAQSSRYSPLWWEITATELEAGGHVTLTIRKQGAMDAAAQLTVVPSVWDPRKCSRLQLRWIFPGQVIELE